MIKIRPRRPIAVLVGIVLVVGGYVGWQLYQGQQLANQYAAEAQKLAGGTSKDSTPSSSPTPSSIGRQPPPDASTNPSSLSIASSSSSPSSAFPPPQLPGSQTNSSIPTSPSVTPYTGNYKQLMASSYQETLQTMQNVKSNTLALKGRSQSLSAYRANILKAQATFSSAEAFVRANPPADEKLTSSYQEFLVGISLAKDSMKVVLSGISSLSPSNFYAAREMGKKAQQQVINGYAHF